MGYYMGDASAARHQGGLFSFVGKAIKTVAGIASRVLPFPASGLAGLVSKAIPAGPSAATSVLQAAGQFIPSLVPGLPPMASSNPMSVSVSTPPQMMPTYGAQPVAPLRVAKRAPARPKALARRASSRRPAPRRRALSREAQLRRQRLRNLGYRV